MNIVVNESLRKICHYQQNINPHSLSQSLRSPWPAVGKWELWGQSFQVRAIDADCPMKPDEQNSIISFVLSKWLLPILELSFSNRWSRDERRLWERVCLRSFPSIALPSLLRIISRVSSTRIWNNIGTQGVQELFFCEVSEIGAFTELFTVIIWLITSPKIERKRKKTSLTRWKSDFIKLNFNLAPRSFQRTFEQFLYFLPIKISH